MDPSILDTSILYRLFREDAAVKSKVIQHTNLYGHLYITIITYYEVIRGLKGMETLGPERRRQAKERQRRFEEFCYQNEVLALDKLSCRKAAQIYIDFRRKGSYYQEGSDILIAGIALANGMAVVTENKKHFEEVAGLTVDYW